MLGHVFYKVSLLSQNEHSAKYETHSETSQTLCFIFLSYFLSLFVLF